MNSQQSELFDGDIGEVKYRFNVPGLSFTDYLRGSGITLRPLRKRRSKYFPLLVAVIALTVMFGLLTLVGAMLTQFDITLYMTIFQGGDETDVNFRHSWWDIGVIMLFLYAFFLGYFALYLHFFRRGRSFQRKVYRSNRSTETGYYLELGEHGLRSKTNNGVSCFKWDSVTGFTTHKGMSFISLFAVSFFWLPDDLDGYDRDAVAAFITAKLTKPV